MQKMDIASQPPAQQPGWTPFLVYCNLIVVLGSGFTFGYNMAVVNGPFVILNNWLNGTFEKSSGNFLSKDELNTQWSLAVSLFLMGGVVGSTWFPSILSASYGKRNALAFGAIFGIVGEALIFISRYTESYIPFMVGRCVAGFHGGLSMSIAPGLLNEHAPPRLRGACGSFFTVGISFGVELANLLGLSYILGTEQLWHYLFLVIAGILLLYLIGLMFIVESPRWLVDKSREKDAINAIRKLRNVDETVARYELEETKQIAIIESKVETISITSVFRDRQFWWPMFIAINLHIVNQMTGLAAVLIYASMVMNNAGLDADLAAVANLGINFAPIIGNFICSFTVDRVGRRPLLLSGMLGMVAVNVFLAIVLSFNIYQASIAGFALFLLFFGYGPGPIPWFMPAEMFNQSSRPVGLAVGTFTNWVGNVAVSFAFPAMQLKITYFSFLPFAVIGLLEFVFLFFYLPETTPKLANYNMEIFATGQSLIQIGKKKPPSPFQKEVIEF